MNNIYTPLLARVEALSMSVFEPTFTFFDNTIVVNYKKTGSRFFEILCKAPIGTPYSNEPDGDNFSTQIDAKFKLLNEHIKDYNVLNLKGVNYLVEFDVSQRVSLLKWHTYSDILKNAEVDSIDTLLKNPKKKLTFVIKNPIDRFFSGVIQILIMYITESLKDEKERDRLKRYTGLTDSDIKYVWKRSDMFFSENFHSKLKLNHETMDGIDKFMIICSYLLENRFDLILQDIHTESYLDSMKFLIDGIENDNYQIIDISQCDTHRAYELFDGFSNNINYSDYFDLLSQTKYTNRHIYDFLYKLYDGPNGKLTAVTHLLKKENSYYQILRNSDHFVNLIDDVNQK
jgi:hypothetical protein